MDKLNTCMLHLGAHKTGTTQIQMLLNKNRRRLEEVNCAFMKYGDLHETFTKQMVYQNKRSEGVGWLKERLDGASLAFLSNEDFMGGYPDYLEGKQYPKALQYVDALTSLFPQKVEIHTLISIRSPADWIESCYLQMLKTRQRQFISFEEFLNRIDIPNFSWMRILEKLLSIDRIHKIHLFIYEDFRKNNDGLYAWIDDWLGVKLKHDVVKEMSNPSYSNLAYRLAEAADEFDISLEHRIEFRKYLRANFNTAMGYEKPKLFPEYVKSLLHKGYIQEIEAMRRLRNDKLNIISL